MCDLLPCTTDNVLQSHTFDVLLWNRIDVLPITLSCTMFVLSYTIDNVHKCTFGEEAPCCTSGDVLPCTRGDVLPCTDGEELPKEAAGGFST